MSAAKSYQPTLFDAPPVKQQAVVLDIKEGRKLRDLGIEKAVMHAEQETAQWSEKAYEFLVNKFLMNHNGTFMAEEVRSAAAMLDFPLPPSARAWGGVIARAAHNKIIEKCGITKVKNKKAHCANAAVWRQIKNHGNQNF
jgi:hypothetical protein